MLMDIDLNLKDRYHNVIAKYRFSNLDNNRLQHSSDWSSVRILHSSVVRIHFFPISSILILEIITYFDFSRIVQTIKIFFIYFSFFKFADVWR